MGVGVDGLDPVVNHTGPYHEEGPPGLRLENFRGRRSAHFAKSDGSDTITDFDVTQDKLVLDGVSVSKWSVGDVNRDGIADLTIAFSQGASVVLLGVSDFTKVAISTGDYYSTHTPGIDFTNGAGLGL